MPDLEEWQHHVIRTPKAGPGQPARSWCGKPLWMGFFLLDADHARRCVADDGRIQPCPRCWAAITDGEVVAGGGHDA